MKKILFPLLFILIGLNVFAQEDYSVAGAEKAQQELNKEFLDPETTVLKEVDFEHFSGLEFFPIKEDYIVEAKLIRTPDELPFLMPTTTSRTPEYVKYGEVIFELEGKNHQLNIYQNIGFVEKEGMEDYLFLPFTDSTNGTKTYGGGRYMDLRIPKGKTIVLDFNRSYNPSCAYNAKYSCPIVPGENQLTIPIEAGVKAFEG